MYLFLWLTVYKYTFEDTVSWEKVEKSALFVFSLLKAAGL